MNCNAIAYHSICDSVAMGESLAGHIRSEDNPADLLTKVVIGHKGKHLVSLVLYDMYDGNTYQWGSKFFSCDSKTMSCIHNVVCMNTFLKGLKRFGR